MNKEYNRPEERRDVLEQRCDVDLIPVEDTRMPARFTRSTRTTDAVQPLLDAVESLGASVVSLTERIRADQRAKSEAESERRLKAIREHLQRPITAGMFQTDGCRRPWRLRSPFRDEECSYEV
jgi:hypothetical protein